MLTYTKANKTSLLAKPLAKRKRVARGPRVALLLTKPLLLAKPLRRVN